MNIHKKICYLPWLLLSLLPMACEKGFLDTKPDKSLLVPETADDLQYLLNNILVMNNQTAYLHEVAADDYFTNDNGYRNMNVSLKEVYTWEKDFQSTSLSDWNAAYRQILYANIILDRLDKENNGIAQARGDLLRGAALFFRAYAMYGLLQQFAPPYEPQRAAALPGLPYPLSADVNLRPGRGSLENAYRQLINDLTTADTLLPVSTAFPSQPSKTAARALLMRVYLLMDDYREAARMARLCLDDSDTLIDYNQVNGSITRPLVPTAFDGNPEVIYYSAFITNAYITANNRLTMVDTLLYRSYAPNDLRKTLFFVDRGNEQINFRGSYSISVFAGLATDEVYLVLSECLARLGDYEEAMDYLNILLEKRYVTGSFVALVANNKDEALEIILLERRKELVSRGLRWADLRRLNREDAFKVTLKRVVNGQEYLLSPGDNRYTFPIPFSEIENNPIEQNKRD